MKKTLKITEGTFYIYNDYLIAEINEGITVTPESNEILINIVETYYNSKNFVYITNRINSYAVDPATYKLTSLIKNLVGFAVVANNIYLNNAEIEKLFLSKPFEIFTELDEAIAWAKSIIKPNNTNLDTSDK